MRAGCDRAIAARRSEEFGIYPTMPIRIEVYGSHASAAAALRADAAALDVHGITGCRVGRLYFIEHDLDRAEIDRLLTMLFVDPVTETASWRPLSTGEAETDTPDTHEAQHIVEVTFRPGVTDVPARELARSMAEIGIDGGDV